MSMIKYKSKTQQTLETPDIINFASQIRKKALKTECWTYNARAFVETTNTNFKVSYIVVLVAAAPDGATVCWMLRATRYYTEVPADLRKEPKSFLAALHDKNYEYLWGDGEFRDEARARIQRAHTDCWPPLERLANCGD